jgi:hypothetical protein
VSHLIARRLVVAGASGRLGHQVCEDLRGVGRDVIELSRGDLDVPDLESVTRVISRCEPHVVINCTAYNAVDAADQSRKRRRPRYAPAVGPRRRSRNVPLCELRNRDVVRSRLSRGLQPGCIDAHRRGDRRRVEDRCTSSPVLCAVQREASGDGSRVTGLGVVCRWVMCSHGWRRRALRRPEETQ